MITASSATINFSRPPEDYLPKPAPISGTSANGNQGSEGLINKFFSALIMKMAS